MLRLGSETEPCSHLLVPKATWGVWDSTRQAGSAQGNLWGLGQHKATWVSTRQSVGFGLAQGNLWGLGQPDNFNQIRLKRREGLACMYNTSEFESIPRQTCNSLLTKKVTTHKGFSQKKRTRALVFVKTSFSPYFTFQA